MMVAAASQADDSAWRLCRAEDVLPGRVFKAELPGGEAIAVYNLGGRFFATQDVCTHATASLSEGEVEGELIICPIHFGEFHIPTGKAQGFPACIDLKTFAVAERDGWIILASGAG
jgi:ethylbenzene dioxygenase ferredoxin component